MKINKETRDKLRAVMAERVPQINMRIAKILLVIAGICFGMWVMFAAGALKSKGLFVFIAFIGLPCVFGAVSVWCLVKKGKGRFFSYVFVVLMVALWFALEMMSGYKTKMLLPVIIVLAMNCYNRRLMWFAHGLSCLAVLASNWCNAYLYRATGLIDLNLVSFDTTKYYGLQGFLYNNIINLEPSSAVLFKNGLILSVFPNVVFITVITWIALIFMKRNMLNILRVEELSAVAANHRVELSDLKTKVMLSQIKPHFIYNTLTTISYFCSEDPARAEELTNRFSDYLRNNLSSLSETETVSFAKELGAIKNYLAIEQIRFEDRVNVVYDIAVEDFEVPVLAIQPIVENAVKHGICKKEDGGTVTIATFEESAYVCIRVADDGVGFDKNAVTFDGKEHVGVKNIITRIQNAGGIITIDSTVGVGTVVTVKLTRGERLC